MTWLNLLLSSVRCCCRTTHIRRAVSLFHLCTDMAPILGYWDIRGLGGAIRSLLHYTGTEFEDKKYPIGPSPEFNREEWLKDKRSLDLDYPNLPYYIDGNVKLTQSIVIMKHLARKHGLTLGNTEEDLCREETATLQIYDVRREFGMIAYSPKFETEKDAYKIKVLPEKLAPISKFMGCNPWLLGNKLTYVDFFLYEMLDFLKYFASDVVNSFSNIKDFMQRFEALPNIQKYQKSEQYRKWPIFMPFATFGGSGDPPAV